MGKGQPYSRKHKPGDSGQCYGAVKYSQTHNVTTRYPRTIIEFGVEMRPLHPTQKPVALCEYMIRTYTNPGEVVLDNCMGSGTTGVACVRTGRRFIGIEREREYFDIARQRIAGAEPVEAEAQTPGPDVFDLDYLLQQN